MVSFPKSSEDWLEVTWMNFVEKSSEPLFQSLGNDFSTGNILTKVLLDLKRQTVLNCIKGLIEIILFWSPLIQGQTEAPSNDRGNAFSS